MTVTFNQLLQMRQTLTQIRNRNWKHARQTAAVVRECRPIFRRFEEFDAIAAQYMAEHSPTGQGFTDADFENPAMVGRIKAANMYLDSLKDDELELEIKPVLTYEDIDAQIKSKAGEVSGEEMDVLLELGLISETSVPEELPGRKAKRR